MQQRCITLIKSESKYNVTKDLDFKQMLIFYSSKNPKKNIVYTQIWSSTFVFNIDNNKCFLSTKSAY